jgi:putative transposase
MSRIARVVAVGVPHHVTQRGNGRQIVFDTDEDRLLYLDLLRKYARQHSLRIWAWYLMSNHIHLLAVPERPDSLCRRLAKTHGDYARYFNIKRRSCGHVWQARFYSCPVGRQQLWMTMAYVERNPVRAGLVSDAAHYRWSSIGAHMTNPDRDDLVDLSPWQMEYNPDRWHDLLRSSVDEEAEAERLREATLRGRPYCDGELCKQLEQQLGRELRAKPVGRPPKTPPTAGIAPGPSAAEMMI